MFKLLPKIILYRFANVKSGLISTHPLEASEKNVSKIIIIITNFPLAEKKNSCKGKTLLTNRGRINVASDINELTIGHL